jgi:hypothetical protein
MRNTIGLWNRQLARLAPCTDTLHAAFDFDQGVLLLKATGMIVRTVSGNPGSIASGAAGTATANVTGLTPAHKCWAAGAGAFSVAVAVTGARCVAPGVVTIDFVNASAGALDLAATNFNILAIPGDI